jgi:hypothetical protein
MSVAEQDRPAGRHGSEHGDATHRQRQPGNDSGLGGQDYDPARHGRVQVSPRDHDMGGDVLQLAHQMAGHQHDAALPGKVGQELSEPHDARRIEAKAGDMPGHRVPLGLASRLAARYWDLDDPTRAADLAGILAEDQVRLVLHPETVNRYAY